MATRSRSVIPDKVSDGGWGWVCVAACAFNQAMYRGVSMSFSILFEAMRQKYGTSATSTAWVYSISGMVTMFSGKITIIIQLISFSTCMRRPSIPY